jgi:glycerol-3-phosphate dehydrogenase (NAD(P)+)
MLAVSFPARHTRPVRIGVLGAGSFGTALAKLLAEGGHSVALWARAEETTRTLRESHENARYLPGVTLPMGISFTSDVSEALSGAEICLAVVPSHGMRDVMKAAVSSLRKDALVVSASKGIETDTLLTMSEVFSDVLPPGTKRAALSGPSFAREVARGIPTAVSLASTDADAARDAQEVFSTDRFRVYTTDDVVGVEMGGALKNVMAIAAGTADGLGFGHNTRAAIITRGLAEIARLAVKKGANPLTLAGLSGIGDLVLTCTGDLSRNRQVGLELGRGKTIDEILGGMRMVAEGVRTAASAKALAERLGVEMPITEQVHALVHGGRSAKEAVAALMGRAPRPEQG